MAQHVSSYVSMEQALEEDRREVMAVLQGSATTNTSRHRGNSLSSIPEGRSPFLPGSVPAPAPQISPDVDVNGSTPVVRHASLPENGTRLSDHDSAQSMLDIDNDLTRYYSPTSPPANKTSLPAPKAIRKSASNIQHHRSQSDASARANSLTRASPGSSGRLSAFSLGGSTTLPRRTLSRRPLPSALGEALRGELGAFSPKGKHRSNSGTSLSSSSEMVRRPASPLSPGQAQTTLDDSQTNDTSTTYKKFSDAALAVSTGGLSLLVKSKRRMSREEEQQRIKKEAASSGGEQALEDSSDESSSENGRGRKRKDKKDKRASSTGSSVVAAEAEMTIRQDANSEYRSRLEPSITVTAPHAYKGTAVHPHTSFDPPPTQTPHDSDHEDIRRAQRMTITMTPINSTPQTARSVRTMYRGDFMQMQSEAHDNQRRVRKYLVATDLSEEAAHALEWTIGTVLRDGDTLLAIYCVDEEIGVAEASTADLELREQAAAIAGAARLGASAPSLSGHVANPSPMGSNLRLNSLTTTNSSASPMGRFPDKKVAERERAVTDITERVIRLLRKTKLQVKVVIEVIACKHPKHLITEVIDFINPTLVILGSRGRSALKGVILGSFSNYLVTKSSVPVMVARKKLKKHTKYKRPATLKLANNLNNNSVASMGRTLASAKID